MEQENNYPPLQLTHRKASTREIVETVQKAKELQRLATNPRYFKVKQKDVVDELIELGAKHITISCLLKKHGLKIQD